MDDLKYIFTNVNDWLKFAEAKCAALLAGNAAIIIGVGQKLIEGQIKGIWAFYISFSLVLFLIGLLFCLVSFIPSLNMPWLFKLSDPDDKDNLLFFDHISKYTPLNYLSRLKSDSESTKFTKMEVDLSQQIIINSVIARRKYSLFKVAVWFTVSGFISPIFAFLLWLTKK